MNPNPPTELEAYEQLAEAMNAVRKRHSSDFFAGPNFAETTLETARRVLASIQVALLMRMDGIAPEPSKATTLIVPMMPETLDRIRRIGAASGETDPAMTAARIIVTWLDRDV